MNWLQKFLVDDVRPILVDGRHVETDRELEQRNQERIEAAKLALGPKWIMKRPVQKVIR